jgi:hypothetical protein
MDALRKIVQAIRLGRETQEEHGEQNSFESPGAGSIPAIETTRAQEEKERSDQERTSDMGNSEDYGEMLDSTPADPLAGEEGSGVKYKTCEWWHVGILMVAECISLGILSLPHAMATLGLVR